jgi:hypoxanthine phosphoribosyltransferase
MKTYISWKQIHNDIDVLTSNIKHADAIIGIGRGGLIPATLLSYKLNVKVINNFQLQSYDDRDIPEAFKLWQMPDDAFVKYYSGDNTILVVDDLSDKGNTLDFIKRFFEHKNVNLHFVTLYIKTGTSFVPNLYVREYSTEEWLVFPWENDNSSCNTDDN